MGEAFGKDFRRRGDFNDAMRRETRNEFAQRRERDDFMRRFVQENDTIA